MNWFLFQAWLPVASPLWITSRSQQGGEGIILLHTGAPSQSLRLQHSEANRMNKRSIGNLAFIQRTKYHNIICLWRQQGVWSSSPSSPFFYSSAKYILGPFPVCWPTADSPRLSDASLMWSYISPNAVLGSCPLCSNGFESQVLLGSLASSRLISSPFYTSAKPTIFIEIISSGKRFDDLNSSICSGSEKFVKTDL